MTAVAGPLMALALAMGGSSLAVADPTSVDDARSQLDELEAKQASLNEQAAETQSRLDTAKQQLADTQAAIETQKAKVDAARAQIVQIALEQFQKAGMNTTATIFASGDINKILSSLSTAQQITATTNSLLQTYEREQFNLAELERTEQAAVTTIETIQQSLANLQAQLQTEIDQTQKKLDDMTRAAIAEQAAKEAAGANDDGVANLPAAVVTTPSSGLIWPTNGHIASPFGNRVHPITGRYQFHNGDDISASCGTPLVAVANGVVVDEYFNSSYGNRLLIDIGFINGSHIVVGDNHLSKYAVSVGTRVTQGQVVAYAGTTGSSTGCHLHFQVYSNGEFVNPMNYLP